ncbi:MAG: hypothetical protein ACO3NK_04235 [Prochlorotrichaceae cyanobacterium]
MPQRVGPGTLFPWDSESFTVSIQLIAPASGANTDDAIFARQLSVSIQLIAPASGAKLFI